ncbi:hypothetical protein [Oricola sp.]|uniref:hypothetical protein n=1 Tax=Oricola sp. TaxID=1979950 RepID=UPI003BAA07A8
MKIYNGDGDKPLDFGKVPVGQAAPPRQVRIVNSTRNSFDVRVRWVYGPRSQRAGLILPAGAGIRMGANPAPFANPAKKILPGQTITVPVNFKPHQVDKYEATLEVQYDPPGTRTQTKLMYTFIIGEGTGG